MKLTSIRCCLSGLHLKKHCHCWTISLVYWNEEWKKMFQMSMIIVQHIFHSQSAALLNSRLNTFRNLLVTKAWKRRRFVRAAQQQTKAGLHFLALKTSNNMCLSTRKWPIVNQKPVCCPPSFHTLSSEFKLLRSLLEPTFWCNRHPLCGDAVMGPKSKGGKAVPKEEWSLCPSSGLLYQQVMIFHVWQVLSESSEA